MLKKENLRFFILLNKTLEFAEIKSFLSRQNYVVKAINEVNDKFISELNCSDKDLSIVLIGFKVNALFPRSCEYINSSAEKTVYEKLLSFLYLTPDDYQKIIIMNQKEGLKGLQSMCLSKEVVSEIRYKEYTLGGITKKDLASLEEDFKFEEAKNGLYKVTVGKERFKSVVIDRAILLSRGLTKYLHVWVCFRDGSPSYYLGDGSVAYSLHDKFQGMYCGDNDWIGYRGRENIEEVADFLNKLYAEKVAKIQLIEPSNSASNRPTSTPFVENRQTVKVTRGKKRK